MNEQAERAAFEIAESEGWKANPKDSIFRRHENGTYVLFGVEERWQGWMMRAQFAAPAAPVQDDAQYQVIVDRRDLFDKLRGAWREGQSAGKQSEAESWGDASRYAGEVIEKWQTMQLAAPAVPRLAAPAALGGENNWINPGRVAAPAAPEQDVGEAAATEWTEEDFPAQPVQAERQCTINGCCGAPAAHSLFCPAHRDE